MTQIEYRQKGEIFLQYLEALLTKNTYLLGNSVTAADIGIMPFVRQFAHVDRDIFYSLPQTTILDIVKYVDSRHYKYDNYQMPKIKKTIRGSQSFKRSIGERIGVR